MDGEFECWTLEPPLGAELVPLGTYQAVMAFSPHFDILTPHLRGIPGFDDYGPHGPIEIHYGNYPGNTEGCCLVGTTKGEDWVGNSREAFVALVKKLPPDFTVTYENEETT